MFDKVVIITGANSGIGKAASIKFAKDGSIVVMACRNIEKSKPVMNEIKTISGNNQVYLKKLDISSFKSIRSFCNDFKNEFQKLDILINNAAYFNHGEDYCLNEDNIELTFATNVLGPFLLTYLMLDYLKKSNDARILNATSNIIKHFFSPKRTIDFDHLQGVTTTKYKHSVYKSYRDSKMAFLMLTFKMAEELKEDGVKVNALQINGAKMSKETLKKFKPGWRLIAHIQNLFFPLPDYIANQYFDLCTSAKYFHERGKLFNRNLEIMEKGPEKVNFKDVWGDSYFPSYANNSLVKEKIWSLCKECTVNYFN